MWEAKPTLIWERTEDKQQRRSSRQRASQLWAPVKVFLAQPLPMCFLLLPVSKSLLHTLSGVLIPWEGLYLPCALYKLYTPKRSVVLKALNMQSKAVCHTASKHLSVLPLLMCLIWVLISTDLLPIHSQCHNLLCAAVVVSQWWHAQKC